MFYFYFIKSETSDSFVNHFNGHFAYLKTLDFYFNFIVHASRSLLSPADTEGHDNMNADLFSETSSMTGESIPASQYTVDSNRSTVFSKVSG